MPCSPRYRPENEGSTLATSMAKRDQRIRCGRAVSDDRRRGHRGARRGLRGGRRRRRGRRAGRQERRTSRSASISCADGPRRLLLWVKITDPAKRGCESARSFQRFAADDVHLTTSPGPVLNEPGKAASMRSIADDGRHDAALRSAAHGSGRRRARPDRRDGGSRRSRARRHPAARRRERCAPEGPRSDQAGAARAAPSSAGRNRRPGMAGRTPPGNPRATRSMPVTSPPGTQRRSDGQAENSRSVVMARSARAIRQGRRAAAPPRGRVQNGAAGARDRSRHPEMPDANETPAARRRLTRFRRPGGGEQPNRACRRSARLTRSRRARPRFLATGGRRESEHVGGHVGEDQARGRISSRCASRSGVEVPRDRFVVESKPRKMMNRSAVSCRPGNRM